MVLKLLVITISTGLLIAQYEGGTPRKHSFQWPDSKKCAVSLSFDDGRTSQLEHGIPILNKYQAKASFYVHPDPVNERLDEWKRAAAAGHEVGNHSLTHPCTGNFPWARDKALEEITLEEFALDISKANEGIEALLGLRPRTFAYPCGQKFVGRGKQVKSTVPVIAEMFLAGRGWLDEGPNDPAFCDLSQLMGMELDGLDPSQALGLVRQTAEEGTWLVFCGHDVGTAGRQTVLNETLEEICRYAQDPTNGIWLDTIGTVAQYVKDHR